MKVVDWATVFFQLGDSALATWTEVSARYYVKC